MRGWRIALAVGLALAATACGGGGKPAAVQSAAPGAAGETPPTTGDPAAAFAACMRDHGVDVPDRARQGGDGTATPPSSRPPGSRPSTSLGNRPSTSLRPDIDQAKLAAAREACQSLQPADRGPANGPPSGAFQVYASCLKDHGVTVTQGGPGSPGGALRDDPAFNAAEAICGPLRPAR